MSDHWNSLADLLGTPSIDPPQKKAAPPKKAERESPRTTSEPAFQAPSDAKEAVSSGSRPLEPVVEAAPPSPKPEQPSRLRSSWDTVARLFGVSSSSELAPAPSDSPTMKLENETSSKLEDDLFSGFGRRQERVREEETSRKMPERSVPDREVAGRPKKKPSSFWDTPNSTPDEPVSQPSSGPPVRSEPSQRSAVDDQGDLPERRGRSRNIRRGRNNEIPESPREAVDLPEADSGRDRGRGDVRNEPVARRNERNDRSSEGSRSGRGERAERTSSRPSQDRTPTTDRDSSAERLPSTERPPRDSERRPRSDSRGTRTNERSSRAEKRPSESEDVQPTRNTERTARSERPARENDSQDRPNRGRQPRREPLPVEDEGEWDSSEVGFEESDERVIERDVTEATVNDDESEAAPSRGRRRRRRGGRRPSSEAGDQTSADGAPGRQAYGRSTVDDDDDVEEDHEEVENLRIHKVTSWLDAISPMIDSNMANHKKNPGGDRNRGGGGGSRRRNNSGSGNR